MIKDLIIRYNKYFMVTGFILISLGVGFLIFLIFFKPFGLLPPGDSALIGKLSTTTDGFPEATTGPGTRVDSDGITPLTTKGDQPPAIPASEVAQGGLTKTNLLNNTPSLDATLNSDGNLIQYLDKTTGQFYYINRDGEAALLSKKIFYNVENVTWSPSKDRAIIEYPDSTNIIYDFTSERQITLPQHWDDFAFSPNGKQIALKSLGLDPGNRWLAISNEDGSQVRRLELIGNNDETVIPSWSNNNQVVAMYVKGVDFNRQEVFFVGLNNENFKSTIVEGRGFQPNWSPRGDRLLYSVYSSDDNLKPNLWVVNAQGESIGTGRKKLNVETWADKCTFDNNTDVYCAVPVSLEAGAGLFPQLADNTADQLYKIDTASGLKKLIAIPDGDFNMSNLILSTNGYYIYFTDKKTGKLHQIKLK